MLVWQNVEPLNSDNLHKATWGDCKYGNNPNCVSSYILSPMSLQVEPWLTSLDGVAVKELRIQITI